jgi:hypothetical protein
MSRGIGDRPEYVVERELRVMVGHLLRRQTLGEGIEDDGDANASSLNAGLSGANGWVYSNPFK